MKDSFIIHPSNGGGGSSSGGSNYSSPDRNNSFYQLPRNPATNTAPFKNNNQQTFVPPQQYQHQQQQQQQRQMCTNNNGGSTSQRYKTELCRPFMEYNHCKYDDKCQFAHGISELRNLSRHPKYKTELCKTFHSHGLCPYGHRCHFIHNNQSNNGGSTGNNNPSNGNSNNVATNPALILGEIGQNNNNIKLNNSSSTWSKNYYSAYDGNSKIIGSSLSSDENLSLCSSPTSSDSSSNGSGPGTFSIMPFDIVGPMGFQEQNHQDSKGEHLLNMGQLDHHNMKMDQFNNSNNNSRLPIFSSMLLRK